MECLVQLCGRLVMSSQIHPLMLYLAYSAQLIILDIIMLQGISNSLLPDAYTEIVHLLDSIPPASLLAFVALFFFVPLAVLRLRLTFFVGIYLICLRQCYNNAETIELIMSLVACAISSLAMVVQSLQNSDNSYRSEDFMRYPSPVTSIIITICKYTIVSVSSKSLPLSVYIPVCSVLLLICFLSRLIYSSPNPSLHKFDMFVYSCLFWQVVLSFGFKNGDRITRNAWILLSFLLAGLTVKAQKAIKQWKATKLYEVNEEEIVNSLAMVMREFRKPEVTFQLKTYCEKVDRFVEFDKTEVVEQAPDRALDITNKSQWQKFVYEVITRCVDWKHADFTLLIDCAYCEDELKSDWCAAIKILKSLENRLKTQSYFQSTNIISQVLNKIAINRAFCCIQTRVANVPATKSMNFEEYKKVDSLLHHSLKISNMYLDMWQLLSQKQVFTDKVVEEAMKVQSQIQKFEKSLKGVSFKCNLLQEHIACFDCQVRLNRDITTKRISEQANRVNALVLKQDLQDYVAIQISLDDQDLGDIINFGMNQNLLELEQDEQIPKLLKRNNIKRFLPSCFHHTHHRLMEKFVKEQSKEFFKPYDKLTYSIINKKLYLAELNLKLSISRDKATAVGFIKINKRVKGPSLILYETETNMVLAHSPEAGSILNILQDGKPTNALNFQLPQMAVGDIHQISLQNSRFRQEVHDVECLKSTAIQKNCRLVLIGLHKTQEEKKEDMPLQLLADCIKDKLLTFRMDEVLNSNGVCLDKFAKAKEQITEHYSIKVLSRLTIALITVLVILSITQTAQIFMNRMSFEFSSNFLTMISDTTMKNWLTARAYFHIQLLDLTLQNRYKITTVDMNSRNCLKNMLALLTKINYNQSRMIKGRVTEDIQVYNITFDEIDIVQVYNQAMSKMKFLAQVDTKNASQLGQINSALSYLYVNQDSIEVNSKEQLLDLVIENVGSENKYYVAYSYISLVIVVGISLAIVVLSYLLEYRRISLKRNTCQSLFLIDQKQLALIICLINDYKVRLKLPPTKQSLTFMPSNIISIQERRDSLSSSKRDSVFRNLHLKSEDGVMMTDDQIYKGFKQKEKSDFDQESQQFMTRKIFNQTRPCNWILFLVYILFSAAIIGLESIVIVNWKSRDAAISNIQHHFDILGNYSSHFSFICNKYTSQILTKDSNTANIQVQMNDQQQIGEKGLELLAQTSQIPELDKFNTLFSQLIYTDVTKYYSGGAFTANISMVLDSVVKNIIFKIRDSYPKIALGTVPGTLLDYLAWVDNMIYTLYSNLTEVFKSGMIDRFLNSCATIFIFSVSGVGVTLLLLTGSVVYNIYVHRAAQKYLKILDIVKGSPPPLKINPNDISQRRVSINPQPL